MKADLVAVKDTKGDEGAFTSLVQKILDNASDANLILMSDNPDILAAGLKACADKKPLIYAATKDNIDRVAELAKEHSCPVAVKGSSV